MDVQVKLHWLWNLNNDHWCQCSCEVCLGDISSKDERLLSLTRWLKHWGEDQQASYPHLDFHPELVPPKNGLIFKVSSVPSAEVTTEPNLCLPLSSLSGTGSGEELLCQVTHTKTHIFYVYPSFSHTWKFTLWTYAWKKKWRFSYLFICFLCFWCFSGDVALGKSYKSQSARQEGSFGLYIEIRLFFLFLILKELFLLSRSSV